MRILVTGGLGFIGSHTVVELVQQGHSVHIVDNLCNSSLEVLSRILQLVPKDKVSFSKVSLLEFRPLEEDLRSMGPFKACIHFAGLKAVGESVKDPLKYYHSNLNSTINLLEILKKQDILTHFIFSSSATVYGKQASPLTEDTQTGIGITNPYGSTKHQIEQLLQEMQQAHPEVFKVTILRYFNPVGAHPSGLLGENPKVANNLMPYIQKVIQGEKPKLWVFGNDYPTKDGTCVRDYIHVVDLAKGHLAALASPEAYEVFNLGTGNPVSVLEMITQMEAAAGEKIPWDFAPRRAGDLAELFASTKKAQRVLQWKAQLTLADMCHSSWNFIKSSSHSSS
jgi:UDP-glucose 4-epimerase